MTAVLPLDSLITRVAGVIMHLSRVAPDRLDNAIEGIDKTIRECRLLAVGNLPSGEEGAGRRPGQHHAT